MCSMYRIALLLSDLVSLAWHLLFLVFLCREGATLSGRQCAYKVLDAAPALAATSL